MNFEKNFLKFPKASKDGEKRFLTLCALIGIIGGALAVGFRLSIETVFASAWCLGGILGEENRFWLMPLIPAIGAFVVGACVSTFAKSAAGSGIPQTKAAYYNNFGLFGWKDALYRFVLGTIFCGSGNSAGREGPTVHLCSAAAAALAQKMRFSKVQIQNSVPAGMGAGIAASFNAPLSAISFVFEELLGGFSQSKRNGGIIIAVVIAAIVARLILGENPVLPIGISEYKTGWWILSALPIAVISGLTGEAFLASLLKMRGFANTRLKLPLCITAALGGLAVGIIAMFAFSETGYNSVFSVGYSILIPAFKGDVCIKAMLLIFAFKFIATLTNYSMGGSGGLFSPTLVIGGMLGGTIGGCVCAIFGADKDVIGACVLLGMSTCFASIIRCPVTSILMIFELTLNYSLIVPLIVANLISYAIARRLRPVGLYDALLMQDGITLRKITSAKHSKDWEKLPVSAVMTFNPFCLYANESAAQALKRIALGKAPYCAFPVLSPDGNFVGIVKKDELQNASSSETKCADICRINARDGSLPTNASISEAAEYFINTNFGQVCILETSPQKKLVGILTLHDLARAYCQQ